MARELISSFARNAQLLGDFVQRTTGSDIDVERYIEPHRDCYSWGSREGLYVYAHSTRASIGNHTVGRAIVYRRCTATQWCDLTRCRMKELLRRLGFAVYPYQYAGESGELRRAILAPRQQPVMVIHELLLLPQLAIALDAASDQHRSLLQTSNQMASSCGCPRAELMK